ncbi:hypothetical protein IQ254_14880 [Nodosilinea sp. LEGE 07088]|uniref:hypothetical protein n=1 Tax=Nodosilinea sp. LEGE 07088 TaxID=2777968 RepID=UPI00187F83D8|nr:hypothetical protein [Nodosilinea sp. LEGE 07088]MBE9138458.1 hypothetical protein [Nodosilinea sp. LEGE 07088]
MPSTRPNGVNPGRDRARRVPMLFFALTYHDALYIATQLGALALVLVMCWKLTPPRPHQPDS